MSDTNVLIVGAGPVGLTFAIDLAWRGIDVTVVETLIAAGAHVDPMAVQWWKETDKAAADAHARILASLEAHSAHS